MVNSAPFTYMEFSMNNIVWRIGFENPNSDMLKRSDGSITVGVTDNNVRYVFLSNKLRGSFLRKVLIHELTHAWMFSYNYILPIEEEEFVCDFVASNAEIIIDKADELISNGLANMRYA